MSGKNFPIKKLLGSGSKNSESANQPALERQTLSVEEAGRILGISRTSAYAYAKDGSLPTIRLGGHLLVPKAALDKLLMTA
jgi:excisionase family DNA binding protein